LLLLLSVLTAVELDNQAPLDTTQISAVRTDFDNAAWPLLIFEFGPTSTCFLVRFKSRF
jgi:hypothetical protein